jgi:hypothetical protein
MMNAAAGFPIAAEARGEAVILLWTMSGPIAPQICFYWRVMVSCLIL